MADFWTGALNKDPKKEFLFKATLGGISNLSWDVKSFTKPKISFSAGGSALDGQVFFGDNFIYKDRPSIEFGDVTVTFVDLAEGGISGKLMEFLSKTGYDGGYYNPYTAYTVIGDGSIQLEQFVNNDNTSQNNASNLEKADTWTFYGVQITDLDFGKSDYSTENLSTVSLTFSYMGLKYNDYTFGNIGSKIKQRFEQTNKKN